MLIFLPLDSMVQIIRAAFASDAFSVGVVPYVKLICWCIAGYSVVIVIMNKK
nr:hypothetical protein [uncultured Blautia sp.]